MNLCVLQECDDSMIIVKRTLRPGCNALRRETLFPGEGVGGSAGGGGVPSSYPQTYHPEFSQKNVKPPTPTT